MKMKMGDGENYGEERRGTNGYRGWEGGGMKIVYFTSICTCERRKGEERGRETQMASGWINDLALE